MDFDQIAKEILELVGKDNIVSFTHCATRLRLTLKSEDNVSEDEVKKLKEF